MQGGPLVGKERVLPLNCEGAHCYACAYEMVNLSNGTVKDTRCSCRRRLTYGIIFDIKSIMECTREVLLRLGRNPNGNRFADLAKIYDRQFGEALHIR